MCECGTGSRACEVERLRDPDWQVKGAVPLEISLQEGCQLVSLQLEHRIMLS